jgi:predicted DNA-binding transcriptional regulator AlpA
MQPASLPPCACNGSAPLLREKEAAAFLGLTPRALQSWRTQGYGPRFVRISGACIRYRPQDLDAWVASRLRESTSEPDPEDV